MKASVPVTIYFLLLLLLLLCAPQRLPAAVAQTTGNRDILLVHSHAMADFSQHLLCRSFIHEMNSADYFCTFHQLELHCRNGDMQQAAERRIEQLLPDIPVLCSATLGVRKPDPAVYRAACTALHCEPARTLFVDHLFRNVQGARTAGLLADTAHHTQSLRKLLKRYQLR